MLLQILRGLSLIGPFTASRSFLLTYEGSTGHKRSPDDIGCEFRTLLPGDVAGGHLHATPNTIQWLCQQHVVNYFIYRDPRDVVVSHAFFVTEIDVSHVHHRYYAHVLTTMEERIRTSITGRADIGIEFPDIRARFMPYLPWLTHPKVMALRFEELLATPEQTIARMLAHLARCGWTAPVPQHDAVMLLKSCMDPTKSSTYRAGKIGSWRQHFTAEHTTLFKAITGDLLVKLGYETSSDW